MLEVKSQKINSKKQKKEDEINYFTMLLSFNCFLAMFNIFIFFNGLIGTSEADLFKDIILVLIVLVNYLGRGLLNDG